MDLLTPEYNILKIAGSSLGYKHTKESLAKEANKRRIGEKNPMFGKLHSEETLLKMSKVKMGKKLSEATRAKRLGRKLSEETRAKMSRAKVGEHHPMYGKKHSDEIKKIRENNNISIEVSNLNTGEINIYSSGKDAAISLGCSSATITRYAKDGRVLKVFIKYEN